MRYLCLVYGGAGGAHTAAEAASRSEGALDDGPFRSPAEAPQYVEPGTTVRVRNGRVSLEAPAGERAGRELTAFFVLEARDLNDAIRMAAARPAARVGRIDVRPLIERAPVGQGTERARHQGCG